MNHSGNARYLRRGQHRCVPAPKQEQTRVSQPVSAALVLESEYKDTRAHRRRVRLCAVAGALNETKCSEVGGHLSDKPGPRSPTQLNERE